jgi:hypothetical protein
MAGLGRARHTASQTRAASLAGRLLVVPTASPDGSEMLAALRMSDGHRAWQVTIGPLAAPLSAVPRGMLVYTASAG